MTAGLRLGLYRHHKGDIYVVDDVVTESTNVRAGDPLVSYWSLVRGPINRHVRLITEFTEQVLWSDGIARSRFVWIPPEYAKLQLEKLPAP